MTENEHFRQVALMELRRIEAVEYLDSRGINRARANCGHRYTPAEQTDISERMKMEAENHAHR